MRRIAAENARLRQQRDRMEVDEPEWERVIGVLSRAALKWVAPLITRGVLEEAAAEWDVYDVNGVADDTSDWLRERAAR